MPARDPGGTPHLFSYWVVFHERFTHPTKDNGPTISAAALATLGEFATRPHVLDRNMVSSLPVLWHALHLPRSSFDFVDLSASQLALAGNGDVSSNIVIIPFAAAIDKRLEGQRSSRPADLVFYDEALDALAIANAFPSALGILPFGDARSEQLRAHWEALATRVPIGAENLEPPWFVPPGAAAQTLLPAHLFARQMYASAAVDDSADHRLRSAWMQHVYIATLAMMEKAEIPEAAVPAHFDGYMKTVAPSVSVNVTIGARGVPPAYARLIGASGAGQTTPREHATAVVDSSIESMAIGYMVAHRASARYGIGAELPPVPDRCFRDLAELEDHLAFPRPPKPRVVRRLLGRISDGLSPLFESEDLIGILRHCKTLTVFSNFPIGLAVLPGATAPLACMFPISYRPLTPLSRTVLQEGIAPAIHRLKASIKVLVLECVDPSDPIHQLGLEAWPALARQASTQGVAEIVVVNASTPDAIRSAIDHESPSILIISAHGFYSRRQNVSGIVVGGVPIMGPELGSMPPLVILSACHVSPRGVGVVSIVDMLLRQGATAVLGTQVPINAMSDLRLLGRFFTNLIAGITGELPLRTIQEVWQHVLATNALYDVLRVSRRVEHWAFEGSIGDRNLLVEFSNFRSAGRLRSSHIYSDTEAILQELANETGFGSTLQNTLSSAGYIPHSVFYYLAGWPERIVVRDS